MKRSEFLRNKITVILAKAARKKLKRDVRETEKSGKFDEENEALKEAATERPSRYAVARANLLKVDTRPAAKREGSKAKADKDEGW
jgi:hypothetical protein